jgi:hypothetical protein
MAKVWKDRVKETTSTTGTGTITLAGAAAQHQSFSAVGNGNTCDYCILSGDGTSWEVGVGTYTSSGTTLSRDTVLDGSSGAGNKISLTGTSTVFLTVTASDVVTRWSLVASWTFSTNVTQVDFTDLGNYAEIYVLTKAVSLGTTGLHALRASTDNGSTFLSTNGDYVGITAGTAVEVPQPYVTMFGVNATAARSASVHIEMFNLSAGPKLIRTSRADFPGWFMPTSTALNAIRIIGHNGGNITGGDIYVYGRR